MIDLTELNEGKIKNLDRRDFKTVLSKILSIQETDRRENALLYYKPVPAAETIHLSKAKTLGIGGGNGSSKTETALVEIAMMATGIVPNFLRDKIIVKEKLRGPVNCRVVCESLTAVLHPIILPKLQYWKWTGVDAPGGEKGHWGWIPRTCLYDGSWDKSWSEKLRMLKVLHRDPENVDRVLGESTIQFMSVDQDASDFASGDFHVVLHDEPPTLAIWRENEARTMRVNGRMMLAMTWPDDPGISVDWIYDSVYEPGRSGPNKDPEIDWFELYSTDNPYLNQDAIAAQAEAWPDEIKQVRIYGQPIRFSNRIHPLFTDVSLWWCFDCKKTVAPVNMACRCGSKQITLYNHVAGFDIQRWPTLFFLDPHPRKPHAFCWIQVSPGDDLYQVAEGEVDGDPTDVRNHVDQVERDLGLDVTRRIMDPNMGRSPASTRRGITWQDEFDQAGLVMDLGEDSDVGRARINEYLKPDPRTLEPRIHILPSCKQTISQFKRYVWDDFRRSLEKDLKQKPKPKYDDFPTLWKYCLNLDPTFSFARHGSPTIRRMGQKSEGSSRWHERNFARS
jgi:hypothetical protein